MCAAHVYASVKELGLSNSSVISVDAPGPRGPGLVKYGVLLYLLMLLMEGDITTAAFAQVRFMRSREGIRQRLRTSIFLAGCPLLCPRWIQRDIRRPSGELN